MIITRFHGMEPIEVGVEFLTPTFLGGADQQAELRSAPFKNLLRQWWRVLNGNLDPSQLLEQEGELFGSVLDERSSSASKVRMSIQPEERFTITDKNFFFGKTFHPEAGKGGINVENALYLGFGPITYKNGTFTFRKYIAPGSRAKMTIQCPKQHSQLIKNILGLIDAFGTIGSRSRNGYGSLSCTFEGKKPFESVNLPLFQLGRLVGGGGKKYPNGFGKDHDLLCWDSKATFADWKDAMKLLAESYMKVRITIPLKSKGLEPRHALGYPVTNHPVKEWGGNQGRMPSQLRLMTKRNNNNQLVARILHLPHTLPHPWPPGLRSQEDIWKQVHDFLDKHDSFTRIGGVS